MTRVGPEIVATRSTFYNDTEDVMGWDISEKGFRIVLSREVPDVVLKNLGHDAAEFLADHGLRREDIQSWVIHTGGPKVLEAAEKALELKNGALDASWKCLKKTGNLSSQAGTRHMGHSGGHGAGVLFGTCFAEVVTLDW
jgi:alkylresorcinol/alkylpyrone synthase